MHLNHVTGYTFVLQMMTETQLKHGPKTLSRINERQYNLLYTEM